LAATPPQAFELKKSAHMPCLELFLIGATHPIVSLTLLQGTVSPGGFSRKKLSNQSNFLFDLCEIRRKNKIRAQTEAAQIRRVRFM